MAPASKFRWVLHLKGSNHHKIQEKIAKLQKTFESSLQELEKKIVDMMPQPPTPVYGGNMANQQAYELELARHEKNLAAYDKSVDELFAKIDQIQETYQQTMFDINAKFQEILNLIKKSWAKRGRIKT